eukprot:109210_1
MRTCRKAQVTSCIMSHNHTRERSKTNNVVIDMPIIRTSVKRSQSTVNSDKFNQRKSNSFHEENIAKFDQIANTPVEYWHNNKLATPTQSFENNNSNQESFSQRARVIKKQWQKNSISTSKQSTYSDYEKKLNDSAAIYEDHDRQKLYYIYNDHQILGPYTTNEIITVYVRRKIKFDTIIYITKATQCKWYRLQIPQNVSIDQQNARRKSQLERMTSKNKIKAILEANEEIKNHIPDIFTNLVENIINNKIKPVIVPTQTPKTGSIRISAILFYFLGTILTILMWCIIGLHFIISAIFSALLYWLPILKYYDHEQDSDDEAIHMFEKPYNKKAALLTFINYFLSYSGMIIFPGFITYFVVYYLQLFPEIQSWMISYIIWGILSFITTMMVHGSWLFGFGYGILGNYLLLIIGVDLGGHDVTELNDDEDEEHDSNCLSNMLENVDLYIAYIFPALASFLPAAVCGFLVNFVWEEQYVLNCSEEVKNSSLCYGAGRCCEIISSHDFKNSYSFVGGLASNILAVFASIRIVGFLMVNANPRFSVYAKRAHA